MFEIFKRSRKTSFQFSKDLTSPHETIWAEHLKEFKGKPGLKYLEIGVFEGRTLISMFQNILSHPSSRATAIDLFYDKTENIFFSNLKLSGFSKRLKFIEGSSQKKLRELPSNYFDILYVDGSHKAHDILSDAVQGWEVVKVGGIMIFDDYELIPEHQKTTPKEAIDQFVRFFGEKLEVLHVGWQYIVRKKAE